MKNRLRVLHILPSILGYGAERQILDLLPELTGGPVEAALLTIYAPPPDALNGYPLTVLHADRKGRRDYFFLPRLVTQISRYKPDIVHTHTHVGKYWGRFAAMLAGVPTIVHTEHNPCDPRRTAFERLADALLRRRTSCTITFFAEQRVHLANFEHAPIERIAVIANGINFPDLPSSRRSEARRFLDVSDDRFAILLIGRMEFQKNHALALRALASMEPRRRESMLLYLAGSGTLEEPLKKLARELEIEKHVRFLGYRSELRSLLPAADLVLMTSWFEGMPLTLIEAMMAGIPILSTPWTGARTMLGDGRFGFLAPNWDASELAREIEHALSVPSTRQRMSERARNHAYETYGMPRMVHQLRNLYAQLAEKLPA